MYWISMTDPTMEYKWMSKCLQLFSTWLMIVLVLSTQVFAFYTPYSDISASRQEETMDNNYYYFTYCDYQGQKYPPGYFSPAPCINCNCNATTGKVHCAVRECPQMANCIKYKYLPGECCPKCEQRGCNYNGQQYLAGAKIEVDFCETCYCPWEGLDDDSEALTCLTIKCPDIRCVDSIIPEGTCCPICPNGPNCWLDKRVIPEGERIYIDKCRYCYCSDMEYIYNATRRHATCTRNMFCG